MSANDLQPKQFKIKIRNEEYNCNPLRLSHRLILGRVQPLFTAANEVATGQKVSITSDEILELETDLDKLIGSLIPELKNITLDILDIAEIITQMMENMIPDDAKELKESKVEVSGDLKEGMIGKS